MNWKNCIFISQLLLILFSISLYGWDLPLKEIDVKEISFNYTSSGDAMTIRLNGTSYITAPEWSNGGQTNNKFAYDRSTAYNGPTVKVIFWCEDWESTDTQPLTIFGFPCSEPTWSLNEQNVTFSQQESPPVHFTTSQGVLPNAVSSFRIDWSWRVSKIDGVQQVPTLYLDGTSHDGFIVLSSPISPQSEPWVGVLDKACGWANGTTTASDCISYLTEGLYNSSAHYDPGVTHSSGSGGLNLTGVLSESDTLHMDCQDFSNYINVLAASLGLSSKYRRITFNNGQSFETYQTLSAGYDDWGQKGFPLHQISWYNSNVIDASMKLDSDEHPETQPPREPKLPSGDMSELNYKNKFTSFNIAFGNEGDSSIY